MVVAPPAAAQEEIRLSPEAKGVMIRHISHVGVQRGENAQLGGLFGCQLDHPGQGAVAFGAETNRRSFRWENSLPIIRDPVSTS